MNTFSSLINHSDFFTSSYTDKSIMSMALVMSAHANWKSRLQKLMENKLPYRLDPDVLAQADDTELGRWIIQSGVLAISDERRDLFDQLHKANIELHQVASTLARYVYDGNHAEVKNSNEAFVSISRQVLILLMDLIKKET